MSQDKIVCSPTGRAYIEEGQGEVFKCSVNCEGTYADMQWLRLSAGELIETVEWMMLNGEIENWVEVNKKKIGALVSEYNTFKERGVNHFRFNAGKNTIV